MLLCASVAVSTAELASSPFSHRFPFLHSSQLYHTGLFHTGANLQLVHLYKQRCLKWIKMEKQHVNTYFYIYIHIMRCRGAIWYVIIMLTLLYILINIHISTLSFTSLTDTQECEVGGDYLKTVLTSDMSAVPYIPPGTFYINSPDS